MALELNNSGRTRSALIATIAACAVLHLAIPPHFTQYT